MSGLTSHETVVMFFSLGVLLAAARILGELAKRYSQPSVLGELSAGILLGPTVLGALAPQWTEFLFPRTGSLPIVLNGLTTLAIVLFLLVAGMEVDLSTVWRQGRAALSVSVAGIVLPFAVGFSIAYLGPELIGREPGPEKTLFALFFATALSISALPVIAKTLMDLNLYRSDLGMIIIAAAVVDDLLGWMIFAVILGLMGAAGGHPQSIGMTIGLTVGFAVFMLTAGRGLIHRALPWIQAHSTWPGGVLGFAMSLALLAAGLTEWIGVHAVFGSFMVGVAIGDSSHLRERTRTIIHEFVSFIFAPLFFASVGLKVNFAAHFDIGLVLVVLVIACIGKILGCGLGARWSGIAWREAWAIGFGMNARGAMEIILGLLALQAGLIRERTFVALVVMALITSMMSGPAMQRLLRLRKVLRLTDYLSGKSFISRLTAEDREGVIDELSVALGAAAGLPAPVIAEAVLGRERIMPTGIGDGIAIPHARLASITTPVVGLGLSVGGVDFDAPDGEPARIVFMVLTPLEDDGVQLAILAEIARLFRDPQMRDRLFQVGGYTELLAHLKIHGPG